MVQNLGDMEIWQVWDLRGYLVLSIIHKIGENHVRYVNVDRPPIPSTFFCILLSIRHAGQSFALPWPYS